mgnify:FL=1
MFSRRDNNKYITTLNVDDVLTKKGSSWKEKYFVSNIVLFFKVNLESVLQ